MRKQRVLLVTADQKLAIRVVLGSTALDRDWSFDTVQDLFEGLNRVSLLVDTSDRVALLIVDADCIAGDASGLRDRLGSGSRGTPVILVGGQKTDEAPGRICVLGRHFSDRQLTDAVAVLTGRSDRSGGRAPADGPIRFVRSAVRPEVA